MQLKTLPSSRIPATRKEQTLITQQAMRRQYAEIRKVVNFNASIESAVFENQLVFYESASVTV